MELNKNIFISRKLKKDSLFHNFSKEGYSLIDISLLKFSPIPFEEPKTEWVFFYSKNGIDFFFDECPYNEKFKYGVMGPESATYFERKTTHSPNFTGNNKGKIIAEDFKNILHHSSISFVKAQNSLGSVEVHLAPSIIKNELICYNNEIDTTVNLPVCDIAALTSPMNAKAFFEINAETLKIGALRCYAIGETTANFIKENYNLSVLYCSEPSEINLYNLIKKTLN